MNEWGIWFLLSCKRYLKKASFLVILLALPAGTFFIRSREKKETLEIRIAVCVEGETENSLEGELADRLVDMGESSLFRFYKCDSEEQVKAEVASRRAECGYFLSAGLLDRLEQKDYRRCIRVFSAPSTVLAPLSTEVVFSALMELYGKDIFVEYIMEQQEIGETAAAVGVDDERLKEQAASLYDKWKDNGSTFRFEYQNIDSEGRGAFLKEQAVNVFPVRGIVAVYLFIVGLYSAVMVGIDEEKGLFLPLHYWKRRGGELAVLAAPVFLAALSGLGALASGGRLEGLGKEAKAMEIYVFAVCVISYVVKVLFRKPQVVCCLIPLFLVGSLVFSPVFVDIGQLFPALEWMEKMFLPSYYLRAF